MILPPALHRPPVTESRGVLLPPPHVLDADDVADDTAPLAWESAATPDELDELSRRYADRAEEAREAHEDEHDFPAWMDRAYGTRDGEPAGWGIGGPYGITWTGRAS